MEQSQVNQWIREVLAQNKIIYSSIGVYQNGDRHYNNVKRDDLEDHLAYNFGFRPGRALFLEGKCIHAGYLLQDRIEALEREFAEIPHTPTEPSPIYL